MGIDFFRVAPHISSFKALTTSFYVLHQNVNVFLNLDKIFDFSTCLVTNSFVVSFTQWHTSDIYLRAHL